MGVSKKNLHWRARFDDSTGLMRLLLKDIIVLILVLNVDHVGHLGVLIACFSEVLRSCAETLLSAFASGLRALPRNCRGSDS